MEQKLATEIYQTAISKGWWDEFKMAVTCEKPFIEVPKDLFIRMFLICKLTLISTEVSEAIEELREKKINWFSRNDKLKPEGLLSEIADIDIRLYDFIEALKRYYKSDYENILNLKAEYNKKRPYKHGKIL